MPLANLGFETAGAAPGLAASWAITVTGCPVEYAGYTGAGGPETAWEGFDTGWNVGTWALPLGSTVAASYGTGSATPADNFYLAAHPIEDFSRGYPSGEPLIDTWLDELGALEVAPYDTSQENLEDFEEEWSNATWSTAAFDVGELVAASYDSTPEPREDFEEEWSIATWSTSIGSLTAANYDAGAEPVEDFEEVVPAVPVTVDPATDKLIAPAHGIAANTPVRLLTDGRAPGNLNQVLTYYVKSPGTDDLQLSAIPGGAAIDIGDQGTGTLYLLVDPARNWNVLLA